MSPAHVTASPARPPTLRQLEARAAKAQKARETAQERHRETLYKLFAAIAAESAAFQALCHARQAAAGNGPAPAPAPPPVDETPPLPGIEEED